MSMIWVWKMSMIWTEAMVVWFTDSTNSTDSTDSTMAPWSIMGIGALLGMSAAQGRTAERRARRTCPEAIPCPRRVSHGWYHERNGSFFLCILMQFAQIFWYFFDLKSCTAGVPSVVPRLAVDAVFDFGDPNVAEASVHRRFFSGCNRYPLVI